MPIQQICGDKDTREMPACCNCFIGRFLKGAAHKSNDGNRYSWDIDGLKRNLEIRGRAM